MLFDTDFGIEFRIPNLGFGGQNLTPILESDFDSEFELKIELENGSKFDPKNGSNFASNFGSILSRNLASILDPESRVPIPEFGNRIQNPEFGILEGQIPGSRNRGSRNRVTRAQKSGGCSYIYKA